MKYDMKDTLWKFTCNVQCATHSSLSICLIGIPTHSTPDWEYLELQT